ncbi:MAG: sulfurtransferase TusA family protein [Candidatus Eutrophobiaceae bacterium]
MMSAKHDRYLNAKGLNCPLPVLKTKVELNRMAEGEVLMVDATDPHSSVDFEAWCARTGNTLIQAEELGEGVFRFYLQRTAASA